jgi:hypothetical protein
MQNAHIDRALTNISVAYLQEASAFIADKVFPIVPVQRQSDLYYTYNKGDFMRDEARVRGAGVQSAGGDYETSTTPYYAKKWAFHKDVTEEERVNYDDPLQADIDAVDFVTQKMLIRREMEWTDNYFKTGVWGTDIQGTVATPVAGTSALQWDLDAADPIRDITNAGITMASTTGYRPNTLVLSPYVFNSLKNNFDVLDRIKYTERGIVTTDLLATLFEVDRVLVPWSVVNTALKGQDDAVNFISGKNALLCYSNPRPGLRKPSAGYIFAWTGLMGTGAYGNRMIRIPMELLGLGTERIEGEMAFDAKLIAKDLGVFFNNIVA